MLRFLIGFCVAGILTSISYVLYSPEEMIDALDDSIGLSLVVGFVVGVLSAFSDRILGFFGQLFIELFP